MDRRPLGTTGLNVAPIGFGAFKIGRNTGVKYPAGYELPADDEVERLLSGALDLGINLIDTAPAYGVSEQRIGRHLAHRRDEVILSTKAGETFEDGRSTYDFSGTAIRASIERSLSRLKTDVIDILLLHSDGRDVHVQRQTDAVDALRAARDQGLVRLIGLSGKTIDGAMLALEWADVLMIEYHLDDTSHERVMASAHSRGIGVLIKKGLASGTLPPDEALRFVLENASVDAVIVGALRLDHLRENVETARRARGPS